MDPKQGPERHSAFFDLERDPKRAELTRPASLLRTTEWGGLTFLSLLVSLAFPPYFVQVMLLAFLNAGGLLWITHLSEAGRQRLREFEREFAKGHALEEAGDIAGALKAYEALAPRYADQPKIAEIAVRRMEHLRSLYPPSPAAPAALGAPLKPKGKPAAKAAGARRAKRKAK
jgi:hypothetical protein